MNLSMRWTSIQFNQSSKMISFIARSFCSFDKMIQCCFIMKKWMIRVNWKRSCFVPSQHWLGHILLVLGQFGDQSWSWMELSYTQWVIQLLFCRFTQKFNICSCHTPAPADIFEPPTKSAAKWYFVVLWHFVCIVLVMWFPCCTR